MAVDPEPAPVPDWLFKLLDKQTDSTSSRAAPGKNTEKIFEGKRNDYLFRRGCGMRAKGSDVNEIYDALLILNQQRCDPPLDDDEIKQIAESVGIYKPGSAPKESIEEILQRAGFDNLDEKASIESIESALRSLAEILKGQDKLRITAVREATIQHLKSLGLQAPAKFVDAALGQTISEDDQNAARAGQKLADPEPWPEEVQGCDLLDEMASVFKRFMVLPQAAAQMLALWVVHTFAIVATHIFPILIITSPRARCGKSLLLEILEVFVSRPVLGSNLSSPVLYRLVDKYLPTVLIDEADTFIKKNEELRGVLNAGHRRGGSVWRCVGDNHVPTEFQCWGPKAIASIGKLKETLQDRSITVELKRKLKTESVERWRPDLHPQQLHALCRQTFRWVQDHIEELKTAEPDLPEELHDRAQDSWRPLFSIASVAGGDWLEKARRSALQLSAFIDEDQDTIILLLSDIRDLFGERTQVSSEDICGELSGLEHRPWPEWNHGKPITPTALAKILRKFHIKPKQVWLETHGTKYNGRGYVREDFEDTFARYLPPEQSSQKD